jgi:cytochrome P450
MRGLLAKRGNEERDDFLGLMAAAATAGEVTEDDVIGNTMLLLIAGHLPVRNLIGNVVWLLQQNPREYERFLAEPTLLGSVIDEALRCEPPVAAIPRIPTEDVVTYAIRRSPQARSSSFRSSALTETPAASPTPIGSTSHATRTEY